MRCDRCAHDWVAVYPAGTESCDCSQCGHEQPVACVHDMRRLESGVRTCVKCGATIQSDAAKLVEGLEAMLGLVEKER